MGLIAKRALVIGAIGVIADITWHLDARGPLPREAIEVRFSQEKEVSHQSLISRFQAKDSDLELSFDDESVAGLPRGEYVPSWFHRCCTLRSYLVSGVA